jgi:ABC-type nitrate/sulfonate/bicarbonate transport system permease component
MDNDIESEQGENRSLQWIWYVIPFGALFLLWEILARIILVKYGLPPISVIVWSLSPRMMYQLGITFLFSILELLVVLLIGLPLGNLIRTSKNVKQFITPVLWFLIFLTGTAIIVKTPILTVLFGISQFLIFLQSIIVPILVVMLISGDGQKLIAIKMGYLFCLLFQMMSEMTIQTMVGGIGQLLSMYYHLHNFTMLYSTLFLIGAAGLFVEKVLIEYMGNKLKTNRLFSEGENYE